MNYLADVRVGVLLIAGVLAGGPVGYGQQPGVPVPITNDTPAQTTRPETTPVPGTGAAVAPVTRSEMKAQKRQQKHTEKAADATAKAAKSEAKAQKQADKATRAQEKAAQPQ